MNLLSIFGQSSIGKMESNNNYFKLRNSIFTDAINKPLSTFWEHTVGLKKGVDSKLTNLTREKPSFLRLDSTGNTVNTEPPQRSETLLGYSMDNKMKRKFSSPENVQKNGFYNNWSNVPQCKMNSMFHRARMNYAQHIPVGTAHPSFQNNIPNYGMFVPPYHKQFNNPTHHIGYNYPVQNPEMYRQYIPEFSQDKMKNMAKSMDKLGGGAHAKMHEKPCKPDSVSDDETKQFDNICIQLATVGITSEYSKKNSIGEQKLGSEPKYTQVPQECTTSPSTKHTITSSIQPDKKMHVCSGNKQDTVGYSFLIKRLDNSSENSESKAAENFCDNQCSFDVFVSDVPNSVQGSTKIKIECKEKCLGETPKKKKKKSRPSQKKRHRLKQQKGLIENPHVSSFIENVKRVKTNHQKCNNDEAKMTSTSSSMTFAVGIDISQASVCDNVEKYEAQVFLRSSSSDESDLESAECDAVDGALWDSFASPMTFNLTCMATAISVQSAKKEEEFVSSPVRDANIRWKQGLQSQTSHCDKKDSVKKVLFDDDHVMVHEVECWERKGPWEEIGRDRERFKNRIQKVDEAIGYIFKSEHRNKVLSKRTNTM